MTDHNHDHHHHHGHDHGHHHDHDHDHDHGALIEEPMDAANKALSDALQVSFRILKGIMVVLVMLYMVSNLKCIESHQQAIVLRMGEILPGVHEAGLVKAWPFPFEEILVLPTEKANVITVDSHSFHRQPGEETRDLTMIFRGEHAGLDPSLDGALLTADKGLVHVVWKITYKFDDVSTFVSYISGAERIAPGEVVQAAERLIRTVVENTGIHVAAELTAEDIVRRTGDVQDLMRAGINERLRSLNSGLKVAVVEMKDTTPPLQVRDAFNATQIAEQNKDRRIREAQGTAVEMKNRTAGAAYEDIVRLLDAVDAAQGPDRDRLRAELAELIAGPAVGGEAGAMITDAHSYQSRVLGRMRSDVESYRQLVPEFERNPGLLISRLWEETRQEILNNPGILKLYHPAGIGQFRLEIGRDPFQRRVDDARKLQNQPSGSTDPTKLLPQVLHPIGPEFD